ncbi:MAG: O-antigen ligase family protein [Pseudohongiellaceae bacterium]
MVYTASKGAKHYQTLSLDSVGAHRVRNRLVCLVSLFAIFTQPLFFSLSGLIGFEYGGVDESPVYALYVILVFIAIVFVFLLSFVKKPSVSKTEFGFYVFFLVLIANHLIWVSLDSNETRLWPDNLTFFLSMGLTGFMAVRVIHAFGAWHELIRLTEVLVILMAIGLVVVIVQPYLTGFRVRGIGGASYQAASYYAAMCFGLLGVATFRLEPTYRYRVFCSRIFIVLNVTLLIALILAVILNGGRGAFVLLALYTALIVYWIATKRGMTIRGVIRFATTVMLVPIILGLLLRNILGDSLLAPGFNRAIAFIGSPDGGLIDLEGGSSGRDRVYGVALRGIAESPWIGHGAFGHWEKIIHPHNLVLDLALQFGIAMSMAVVFVAAAIFVRRVRPLNTEKVWLLTLYLYPVINLMFSGGYLRSSLFWFGLAGILVVGSQGRGVINGNNSRSQY